MLIPAILDERAPSVSRVPSHSGQTAKVATRSTKALICGCRASRSFDSIALVIFGMRPSYVMFIPAILIFVTSPYRNR